MRVQASAEHYNDATQRWSARGRWPARWIAVPGWRPDDPGVWAYRLAFEAEQAATVRLHVSADERYRLFLDGQPIGAGPERGDQENWFYESYDLALSAGRHVLVAQAWWLGPAGPAPYAQMTVRHGFLLSAEGEWEGRLSTGLAAWECRRLGGYRWLIPKMAWGVGAKVHIRASEFASGFERGEGNGWAPAAAVADAVNASIANEQPATWLLRPAMLGEMFSERLHVGVARHVQAVADDATGELPVRAADHLADEAAAWNAMLAARGTVTLAAGQRRQVIVDLGDYYCAYPELTTSGGAGASVRLHWAESLFEAPEGPDKGHRDRIEGKFFRGAGDLFEPDGGPGRRFETLWWEAGRYVEIVASAGGEPLTIDELCIRQTHHPLTPAATFECSDGRLTEIVPIMVRALQMCSHETYMDCPYYEQLMYVGDTRLEVLATWALTGDDRLPRKAAVMFDRSRVTGGLTQSRYPSRVRQVIPPFSLWWIAMVHDRALWRDDAATRAEMMPGVRAVVNAFEGWVNGNGLIERLANWAYMDWVPAWKAGVPPGGEDGISGPINLHYLLALRLAAELEEIAGEPELAARCRRLADRTAAATVAQFYDAGRGLLADDVAHEHFSEHAQCLALLGGVGDAAMRGRLAEGLFAADDLARTTIYFTHYYFETCRLLGRMDRFMERMGLWFDLRRLGCRTTLEAPEPSRSDCHAWAAHPAFHYLATILGIRPASPGFASVRVQPQLGPLAWARGSMPHPAGRIGVDVRSRDGRLTGSVELPAALSGTLEVNGRSIRLAGGLTTFP
ncbi:MAG: hypothetical protein BIFFINMI_01040 [Phycisphaerae bacterium]|nr:hypothetical protein [Phycisphaerae bacterium]